MSNVNERTPDNIHFLEQEFVERDWMPNDKVFLELLLKKGKVTLNIQLLEKNSITISIPESKTVRELMTVLISYS